MLLQEQAPAFEQLNTFAESSNIPLHMAAMKLNSPHIAKPSIWPDVKSHSEAIRRESGRLCISERGDLLTELSKGISGYLQFPESTIFMHGLGCVASALCKSFKFEYSAMENLPVNLYVITAQPPSTGKSHVNNRLFTPIRKAYDLLGGENKKERERLSRELKKLQRSLESGKKSEHEEIEISDMIDEKEKKLAKIPEWHPFVTNATPEAIENVMQNNRGIFGIVSAEAEAINVVASETYKTDSKKNFEVLLKAWDGEYYSSARVTRSGYKGDAVGSICVCAQEDTIDTMLQAAAAGRGLPERFLLLSENSYLGKRDHFKKYKFDKSLHERYEKLIKNIVFENDVVLKFSESSNELITSYKQRLEPLMSDDSKYSHSLFTGFIGKADKQVRKIACILHCIDNWQSGGKRLKTVDDDYVTWAIGIFDELRKTFVSAADFMGHVGRNSEVQKVISVFDELAERNKSKISFTQLRDKVRNVKPFKGSRNVSDRLKDEVIPKLEKLNYCLFDGKTIYINPKMK